MAVSPKVGRGPVDRFSRHKSGREVWCPNSGMAVRVEDYVVEEVSFEAVAEEER